MLNQTYSSHRCPSNQVQRDCPQVVPYFYHLITCPTFLSFLLTLTTFLSLLLIESHPTQNPKSRT